MEYVDFRKNVRKLSVHLSLGKSAVDLLNEVLKDVNSKLVNSCLEKTLDKVTIAVARDAVKDIFSGLMRNLANAEANRIVTLYKNGLMVYEPEHVKKITVQRKKKALEFANEAISRGVNEITNLNFPQATLEDAAKEVLSTSIGELAVAISAAVQSHSKTEITRDSVRVVVEQLFPEQLSNHAIAEAARLTILFETGLLEFRKPVDAPAETSVEHPTKKTPRRPKTKAKPKTTATTRKRKRTPSKATTKREKMISAKRAKTVPTQRKTSRDKKPKISTTADRDSPKIRAKKRKASRKLSETPQKRRQVSKKKAISKKKTAPKLSRRGRSEKIPSNRVRAPSVDKMPSKRRRLREEKITPESKRASKKVTRVSKPKLATKKISLDLDKGINLETKNINKNYNQKLSPEAEKRVADLVFHFLNRLINEMKNDNQSNIGPKEVKSVMMNILAPSLAEIASAHLNKTVMILALQ